jgi:hypothetical protein
LQAKASGEAAKVYARSGIVRVVVIEQLRIPTVYDIDDALKYSVFVVPICPSPYGTVNREAKSEAHSSE